MVNDNGWLVPWVCPLFPRLALLLTLSVTASLHRQSSQGTLVGKLVKNLLYLTP